MSMREEDRQKNNCPSRGLGLAAAAIGVGVGAALYYFFSKRPENPDGEGSTSGWACEQPHAFSMFCDEEDEESEHNTTIEDQQSDDNTSHNDSSESINGSDYTTVSETTTTDTSVHDSEPSFDLSEDEDHSYLDLIPQDSTAPEIDIQEFIDDLSNLNDGAFLSQDWDVTDSSLDVPEDRHRSVSPLSQILHSVGDFFSPMRNTRNRYRTDEQERLDMLRAQTLSEEEQIKFLKDQKFRERSWSLEECSICFEIMLKDQQLTRLPCAHNFHSNCITPWLAEQQTCPNCRKAAE